MAAPHSVWCSYRREPDTICEPQLYPKLKQRAKTGDKKSSPKSTKQQQQPIYKCPGPAAYSPYLDAIKRSASSFSMRSRSNYAGVLMLDDGRMLANEKTSNWDDPGNETMSKFDVDKVRPKGTCVTFHGSCPLHLDPHSPGPATYYVEGNVTRKGPIPGYRKWSSCDYSMGWRSQRKKFSVENDVKMEC